MIQKLNIKEKKYNELQLKQMGRKYLFFQIKLNKLKGLPRISVQKPQNLQIQSENDRPINKLISFLKEQIPNRKYYTPIYHKNELKKQKKTHTLITQLQETEQHNRKIKTQVIQGKFVDITLSNSNRFYFNSTFKFPETHKTIQCSQTLESQTQTKIKRRNLSENQNLQNRKKLIRRGCQKVQKARGKQRVRKYQQKMLQKLNLSKQIEKRLKKDLNKIKQELY